MNKDKNMPKTKILSVRVYENTLEEEGMVTGRGGRAGKCGELEKGEKGSSIVLPCFGSCVVYAGVWNIACAVWCTNGVSFVFVVVSGLGIGWGGGLEIVNKSTRKGSTRAGRKLTDLFRALEERGVSLSSITLLGNSESFIKGFGDQGSGWNVYGSMIQKI